MSTEPTTTTTDTPKAPAAGSWTLRLSALASVKLTILSMVLIAATVLVGAWCPQESAVGFEKVVEAFDQPTALKLREYGITDIFHSPWFLTLILVLTVNMIACSFQRVFPKVRTMKHKMPHLGAKQIENLAVAKAIKVSQGESALAQLAAMLKKRGFTVDTTGSTTTMVAERGKFSKLAATVTHIGLLSLLAGVTITSWTGFSGFAPIEVDDRLTFDKSEHSKLWIGSLPKWSVLVQDSRREDYENGDAKQWYSKLAVVDTAGKIIKQQEISVNNPLSYDGVDVYQSSWGLSHIIVSFNGRAIRLNLQQMGQVNAAMMPLDNKTIFIFSLRKINQPIRLFAKTPEWPQPRMLTALPLGVPMQLGQVKVKVERIVPATGLQYKCDPGLPFTYTAFSIIMAGVLLAAVPHYQVWASLTPGAEGYVLSAGGVSRKAKKAFERLLETCLREIKEGDGGVPPQAKIEDAFAGDSRDTAKEVINV